MKTAKIRLCIARFISLAPVQIKIVLSLLEQIGLATVLDAKMIVSQSGGYPTARSTVKETNLDKEGLIDLFQRLLFLRQRGGQSAESHRSSVEFFDDGQQQPAVHLVKTMLVDFKHLQRRLRCGFVNAALAAHLGKVAYTTQQTVRDARCAPCPVCQLVSALGINSYAQNLRRPFNHEFKFFRAVELQPQQNAKARTQRRGEQSRPSGGRHKSKRAYVNGVCPGGRPLPNDDVQLVILKRRIKNFFQRGLQAMHLVQEKHLTVTQVGQNGREVAFDLDGRPGALLVRHAHLIGNDGGQRGLSQSRRTIQQHVVQRFSA